MKYDMASFLSTRATKHPRRGAFFVERYPLIGPGAAVLIWKLSENDWVSFSQRFSPQSKERKERVYRATQRDYVTGAEVTSNASWQKRCQPKNPRFSRVFFVFRRFPHFFEIRILVQIKRWQSAFSGKGAEVNLPHVIFTANIEKHQKIWYNVEYNSL